LPQPEQRAPVEGYTDQVSYQAGDEIKFHISSAADRFDVEIARVGAERVVVWKKVGLAGKQHPIPADASSHGCRWPMAFSLAVPAEWSSGYYTGRLTATLPDGKTARPELWFVVRSDTPAGTRRSYCNSRRTRTTPTRTGAAIAARNAASRTR